MLGVMRKYAYSWTIRAVLLFIAAAFAFWGVGTGLFSQVHPVASVNDQQILANQLDQEAARLRQQLQQMYGPQAATMLTGLNLREQALQLIIERIVIDDEARRLGLQISNSALEDNIASQSAFQIGGHFDFRTYEAVLRDNNLLPAEYEQSQRAAMLAQQMQKMVMQAIQLSDDEARRIFNLENELISLSYFEIPYSNFTAAIHPTDQQIAGYYQEHGEEFREPERIKIAYIFYDPMTLAAKSNPTEKESKDYYERHLKTLFTHPEQVHARHILIALPASAGAKAQAAAKAKAEDVLKQLKAGVDFAKLAEKYSEDPGTRLAGGDLGFLARGQVVKPFEDAAFDLKPGGLTITRTPLGYHVIRVDAIKPAHVDLLEEARPVILDRLKQKAGGDIARQDLNQDLPAALSGESFSKLAEKRGLTVVETPFFAEGDRMSGTGDDPNLLKQSFKMQKGDIRAIVGGKTSFLVKLIARNPSHIPPLKEIEASVRETFRRQTAEAEARTLARKLLKQIKNFDDFRKVAAADKFEVYTTPNFPRSGHSVPGIGEFPEVTDAAALVAKLPGLIDRVMEKDGNTYLFAELQRRAPSDQEWAEAASDFKKQLLKARRQQAWAAFLDALRSRADIRIDPNQLGQSQGSRADVSS